MAGSATARRLQTQIVKEGVIAGTVTAVRATIKSILDDSRFHRIEAAYGPNPKPKPGKEPGTPYFVTVAKSGPTKGVQTEAQVAARVVDNDLINVYCADNPRHGYRSLKVPTIKAVWVYTGRVDLKTGKAESVRIPVVCVDAVSVKTALL